ncbi:MAG: hypothetical protein CBD39_01955 [Flavobacteriaceae bacterium TMED179]|nr:MAG: hypothetical protein CBD39_01955 [Flavobacteriaceae bacterium TMED179]|tara:strand:+ start:15113 stop:15418 length:306 start_codon:yes stop_codon:yes gene_type:complete
MMEKSKNRFEIKTLKEVLKDVVSQKPLKKGVENIRICNSWEEVMGENVKIYTSQVRFSHNILYVKLISAPLKMELKHKLELIKESLNLHLGGKFIKKVVLN